MVARDARCGQRTLPLPFPLRGVPAVVSWHHRHDTDPAHRWLRRLVTDIIAARLDPVAGQSPEKPPIQPVSPAG